MITYTVSPNNPPVYISAPKGQKGQKMILPTVKQHLFFATGIEYLDIQSNPTYAKLKLFSLEGVNASPCTLIRANSVVEYECGINLNNSSEIVDFLDMLKIQGQGREKQQYEYNENIQKYLPTFKAEYHLEHNYDTSMLTDEQKRVLTDHAFPNDIFVDGKKFVLHSIGANLCKQMIDNSLPTTENTKGRHIQIIYIKENNNVYLKFKKPEPDPNIQNPSLAVSEISQYPEHDAIYVNIHFSKQANSDFDEQLHNIGKDFNYVTNPLKVSKGVVPTTDRFLTKKINDHYSNLKKQFADSVEFAMRDNFNNSNHLYSETLQQFQGCSIKVGKKFLYKIVYLGRGNTNTQTNAFYVNFGNGTKKNFLNLDIQQAKLVAPVDLNNILRTNIFDEEENESESESDDQGVTTQSNEEEGITGQSATSTLLDSHTEQSDQVTSDNKDTIDNIAFSALTIDEKIKNPGIEKSGAVSSAAQGSNLSIGRSLVQLYKLQGAKKELSEEEVNESLNSKGPDNAIATETTAQLPILPEGNNMESEITDITDILGLNLLSYCDAGKLKTNVDLIEDSNLE